MRTLTIQEIAKELGINNSHAQDYADKWEGILRAVAGGTYDGKGSDLYKWFDGGGDCGGSDWMFHPFCKWQDEQPVIEIRVSSDSECRTYVDDEDEAYHRLNVNDLKEILPAIDDAEAWEEIRRGLIKFAPTKELYRDVCQAIEDNIDHGFDGVELCVKESQAGKYHVTTTYGCSIKSEAYVVSPKSEGLLCAISKSVYMVKAGMKREITSIRREFADEFPEVFATAETV